MDIRSARELGALIRDRRRQLNLDQASLAEQVGVTRQWLSAMENGKPGVELGLVLRTLRCLSLSMNLRPQDTVSNAAPQVQPSVPRSAKPNPPANLRVVNTSVVNDILASHKKKP